MAASLSRRIDSIFFSNKAFLLKDSSNLAFNVSICCTDVSDWVFNRSSTLAFLVSLWATCACNCVFPLCISRIRYSKIPIAVCWWVIFLFCSSMSGSSLVMVLIESLNFSLKAILSASCSRVTWDNSSCKRVISAWFVVWSSCNGFIAFWRRCTSSSYWWWCSVAPSLNNCASARALSNAAVVSANFSVTAVTFSLSCSIVLLTSTSRFSNSPVWVSNACSKSCTLCFFSIKVPLNDFVFWCKWLTFCFRFLFLAESERADSLHLAWLLSACSSDTLSWPNIFWAVLVLCFCVSNCSRNAVFSALWPLFAVSNAICRAALSRDACSTSLFNPIIVRWRSSRTVAWLETSFSNFFICVTESAICALNSFTLNW